MATISSQKVQGFLKSPRTYPRGGLGFGIDAGAISVTKPSAPITANRMNAEGTLGPIKAANSEQVTKQLKANFQTKAAEFKGKGMLEKIKQLALEKCAGDEQKAYEFLEGFYDEVLSKQAALNLSFPGFGGDRKHLNPAEEAMNGFGKAVGEGLAGITMGLSMGGISSAMKLIRGDIMHTQFMEALNKAIASNPILRQAKRDKVVNYAMTIFKFAPHVATDANLLSSILANAIHGEGVDPQTIKTLTELESRYTTTTSTPAFSPKAYV